MDVRRYMLVHMHVAGMVLDIQLHVHVQLGIINHPILKPVVIHNLLLAILPAMRGGHPSMAEHAAHVVVQVELMLVGPDGHNVRIVRQVWLRIVESAFFFHLYISEGMWYVGLGIDGILSIGMMIFSRQSRILLHGHQFLAVSK